MDSFLQKGNVVAIVHAKAKAKTVEDWNADMDKVWNEVVPILKKQKGFRGVATLWPVGGTDEVIMMAFWENLECRLAYERTVASPVRASFETTVEGPVRRPKYVVTRSEWVR